MDYSKLALVLRQRADSMAETRMNQEPDHTTAELLRVLARILQGTTIDRAFGAPGDWGYGTLIGAALNDAYRS